MLKTNFPFSNTPYPNAIFVGGGGSQKVGIYEGCLLALVSKICILVYGVDEYCC